MPWLIILQQHLKNYFDVDILTVPPGFPHGLGYIKQGSTWGLVSTTLLYDDPATFLERINVCDDSKDKDAITTMILHKCHLRIQFIL